MAKDAVEQSGSKTAKAKGKMIPAGLAPKVTQPMGFGPMLTLLAFSTAMVTLPLATYFSIVKYIVNSTTFAAMGAVVMVQLIVAGYIYRAWTDENNDFQAELKKKTTSKKDR